MSTMGDGSAYARYGLQVIEEALPPAPPAPPPQPSLLPPQPHRLFDSGLLAALCAVELAYLTGLGFCVRWMVRQLLGA